MFVGHFGVGLGLKAAAPAVSLGTLFLAAQLADLLWPTLLLLGLERVEIVPGLTAVSPLDFVHYPLTHSLASAVAWGLLFALAYQLQRRNGRAALVCGAAVVSHWVLDLVSHRPDLPLYPGGDLKVGMGLWDSLAGTLAVELGVYAAGAWLYLRGTRATDRVGAVGLWALLGFLLVVHVSNLFGPPPPSAFAIAWVGQAQWLLVGWAYWVDGHRTPRLAAVPDGGGAP